MFFNNTSLTTDMVKVLAKRPRSRVKSMRFIYQEHILEDFLHKELANLQTNRQNYIFSLYSMSELGHSFAYQGRIAKMKYNCGAKSVYLYWKTCG
jgi:hypothetical protein